MWLYQMWYSPIKRCTCSKGFSEAALGDAWAHWDRATAWYEVGLEDVWAGRALPQMAFGDVLVASARPKAQERPCTLTIQRDSRDSQSDRSPSLASDGGAAELLLLLVC